MSEIELAAAQQLYDAFDAHDGRALLDAMSPSFRGIVSAGMPHGLGGVYEGPERMLGDCWAPVFAELQTRPVPDEFIPAGADRMVVTGHYVGHARATGRRLDAAFAHVLRFEDGRVSELVQITDTARWHDALRP